MAVLSSAGWTGRTIVVLKTMSSERACALEVGKSSSRRQASECKVGCVLLSADTSSRPGARTDTTLSSEQAPAARVASRRSMSRLFAPRCEGHLRAGLKLARARQPDHTMHSMVPESGMYQSASMFSSLLSGILHVAMIIFVFVVIRKWRPDAYMPVLVWSIVSLGLFIGTWALGVSMSALAQYGGWNPFVTVTISQLLRTAARVVDFGFLAYGIYRLARAKPPVELARTDPYR